MNKQLIYDIEPSLTAKRLTVSLDIVGTTITETHTLTEVPPAPVPVPGRKNLIVDNPFASNSFTGLIRQPVNRISLNNGVVRVDLNKGDPKIGGSYRSEINRKSSGDPFKNNTSRWFGITITFPEFFKKDTIPEIVFQLHEYSGTASPHFALWSINYELWIAIDGKQVLNLGQHPLGDPIDFVFHFHFSTGPEGLIEFWMNGKKNVKVFIDKNMPQDKYLPYVKFGIYKWLLLKSSLTTRTVYFENFRMGNELATYNDVKPGNY